MKPGFIPFTDQVLSITDAISMSGGFDPNAADPSHVYIIRAGLNLYRPKVYWLNAKTPESLLLAEHFILKPGDILYVSSAPATRWNRVLNQLLPTIQTVWYTKSIIDNG
jgi:polysaccharide export outer membrane protein